MCRWGALIAGLLAVLLVGCATRGSVSSTSLHDGHRSRPPLATPNMVEMIVALIERPLGDEYLNKGLWTSTDEMVVDLDRKSVLEDNGFRVGHVVGLPPSELHALLTSEVCCVNPRRRLVPAGNLAPILLGPIQAQCRYRVAQDSEPAEEMLDQAQCSLDVLPTLTADGKIRLRFTPKVEYGDCIAQHRVAADRSGLMLEIQKRSKVYPALAWEVTMGANEYLVIGGSTEEPLSLGYQCFVEREGPKAIQRLLVIRPNRYGAGVDAEIADNPADNASAGTHPPPLALQATMTTIRASSQ